MIVRIPPDEPQALPVITTEGGRISIAIDPMSNPSVAEWHKRRQGLQYSSSNQAGSSMVPPMVHEVLESGRSRPLDDPIRAWMERRFGHDFGRVRIHTDPRAAESARAVNARAYTPRVVYFVNRLVSVNRELCSEGESELQDETHHT